MRSGIASRARERDESCGGHKTYCQPCKFERRRMRAHPPPVQIIVMGNPSQGRRGPCYLMWRAMSRRIGETGRPNGCLHSLDGERTAHHVERGGLAGPEGEGKRALVEQHGQSAPGAQSTSLSGADERCFRRRVDKVEDDGVGWHCGEQVQRERACIDSAYATGVALTRIWLSLSATALPVRDRPAR